MVFLSLWLKKSGLRCFEGDRILSGLEPDRVLGDFLGLLDRPVAAMEPGAIALKLAKIGSKTVSTNTKNRF
ncbi:hypothetical protein [Geitlerinema sp. PCC 7407]|uniref:hypothetical protein n=1 Tax=Geitlerinema sp. PCC 7407 TaxID=1173025 RepID=UPI00029FFB37|nr:hypothetical protein [Geitlerinema sp. PCC 7407]AFY65413.1 hypothetical protein GEI7407_0915 [Geitlerinema sp. PCC 7407]